METLVLTPQKVFMQPQRLVVPLFQRRYTWNEKAQWVPLWDDVCRVAHRLLYQSDHKHVPHFLGAVVLQQQVTQTGFLPARTIIDGQQRLTTLQLLLDAVQGQLEVLGSDAPAKRLRSLVLNDEAFCASAEERFKVCPTNRDRAAFHQVMGAAPPVNYDALGVRDERIVQAHRFFAENARAWLQSEGADAATSRAAALERAVRELLQVVVIELAAEENAQEIFETLNARGAQLTAVDLIKNFVFQRLLESGADVESIYEKRWREFETGFWETEVQAGRTRLPRASAFINHWLISRTGEEVVARELFDRFKQFVIGRPDLTPPQLVEALHSASAIYRSFIEGAAQKGSAPEWLGLFAYRLDVLESDVFKPFILGLLDPGRPPVPIPEVQKAFRILESWLVRRMLVRATTKAYNQVGAELVKEVEKAGRSAVGDAVEDFFAKQTGDSRYWPDNTEVAQVLESLSAYTRLGRGRLRMVLETVEDYFRGFTGESSGLGEERVVRGKMAIEHVMPRKWETHWPLPSGDDAQEVREATIHTLGNLTLVRKRLNSKMRNGPWAGSQGKRSALNAHDVLFLNRDLVSDPGSSGALREAWTEADVKARTKTLIEAIQKIWPVPEGHKVQHRPDGGSRSVVRIGISDLIADGLLHPGTPLFARGAKSAVQVATVLSDGRIDVDGKVFDSVSAAATSLRGSSTNGWWFFLLEPSGRSLKHLWQQYVDTLGLDEQDEVEGVDDGPVVGRPPAHLEFSRSEAEALLEQFSTIAAVGAGEPSPTGFDGDDE